MLPSSTILRWSWQNGGHSLSGVDPTNRCYATWDTQGPDTNPSAEEFKRNIHARLASRTRHTEDDPNLICAAVLVPLLYGDGEWHVLVTQRTEQVEHHKGQISFPGGACDTGDAGLRATALRETFEEIGVPPESVEVLGQLDDFPTISNF